MSPEDEDVGRLGFSTIVGELSDLLIDAGLPDQLNQLPPFRHNDDSFPKRKSVLRLVEAMRAELGPSEQAGEREAESHAVLVALVEDFERVVRRARAIPLTGRIRLRFDDYESVEDQLLHIGIDFDTQRRRGTRKPS